MVTLLQVQNGIKKYYQKELAPNVLGFNNWLAGSALQMALTQAPQIMNELSNNEFVKALNIIDNNGKIDIDKLHKVFKEQAKDNPIHQNIKFLGSITFNEHDIDMLYNYIKEA